MPFFPSLPYPSPLFFFRELQLITVLFLIWDSYAS